MSERLSESEEELRDSLATAAEAGLDEQLGKAAVDWWPDTEAWALDLADRLRPVVHSYTAQVIAELADLLPHSRQPVDMLLRWASDEYAKGRP